MDYIVKSAIRSRDEVLAFREVASEDLFIERSDQGGTKAIVVDELPTAGAYEQQGSWSIQAQDTFISQACLDALETLSLPLSVCGFHLVTGAAIGKFQIDLGKFRYARMECGERLVENITFTSIRISNRELSEVEMSAALQRICLSAGYKVPKIETINGRPVWQIDGNPKFRVSNLQSAESLRPVISPNEFIDLRWNCFKEEYERLQSIAGDAFTVPENGEFVCAGDGVDLYHSTREKLMAIMSPRSIWKFDASGMLRPETVSILNGGSLVEGIDYIPFFQVGATNRLPSMSCHSIKHHGGDKWQIISSHHFDRKGMILWLRSLSPSLYPNSIE